MDRREFIRIVTSIGVSNVLLATLPTWATGNKLVQIDGEAVLVDEEDDAQKTEEAIAETVNITNKSTNLVLNVSGQPGRFVVVLYRLMDRRGMDHTFIHKISRIRRTGVAGFVIDLGQSLDIDIPFMVVTSDSKQFTANNRGTDWFTIRLNSGETETNSLQQSHDTDPSGEHQIVVRHGIIALHRRSFAPLGQL